jgi:5,10-methylenetetrahydrofolate reductase
MMKTNLQQVLNQGHFAVTAEIGPPKGSDPQSIVRKTEQLNGFADAFNITDNQTAVARMSSLAGACIVRQQGMEPVFQMACRDRNRLALQADILGASALGIHNMLFVTGDHQSKGNHPHAKGVFDIDSIQLISIAKNLRDMHIFENQEMLKSKSPQIFIGGVSNPFVSSIPLRVDRLEKKIRAGADFIQTQSVFNLPQFEEWMDAVRDRGLDNQVHILAGITPLKSVKMMQRMKYHVPGVDIPDNLEKRMLDAEDVKEEALLLTDELIRSIKLIKGVHGVHITALFWELKIPEIVKKSGLLPR